MPYPHHPDPARIEAALPPIVRDALPALEAGFGVPRGRWWGVPALRQVLEVAAATNLSGSTAPAGQGIAAARLGISEDAVLKRLRRAQAAASTPEDNLAWRCSPGSASVGS